MRVPIEATKCSVWVRCSTVHHPLKMRVPIEAAISNDTVLGDGLLAITL